MVGLRLGCLNHALLTAEAIAVRGLSLAGWIGNRVDPDMPHWQDNIAALRIDWRRRCLACCPGWAARVAPIPWLRPAICDFLGNSRPASLTVGESRYHQGLRGHVLALD